MRHSEVFFPFLRDLPTGAKIIPAWASLSRSNPKCWGISFTLWKILRWLIRWPCEWIILFFFFVVVFSSFKSWGKSIAMHNSRKSYWSNIWRVLLFFFNIRHYEKSIYWTRSNVQLNYGLWIYFLFLHAKIKTAQKISQFILRRVLMLLWNYLIDFISLSKVLRCESYPMWKSCRIIRFKWKQEVYPIWTS